MDFDISTKEKMHLGHVLEADTITAVAHILGQAITQFPLYNDIWSGYADLILGHHTPHPIIVEHKATGDRWWDYKESLPRSTHLCQLWLYGQLYEEQFDIKPTLVLYYRSWDHYAEFTIDVDEEQVIAKGIMDDVSLRRYRSIAPTLLRQELEQYYISKQRPDTLPEDLSTWTYAEDSYLRLKRGQGSE